MPEGGKGPPAAEAKSHLGELKMAKLRQEWRRLFLGSWQMWRRLGLKSPGFGMALSYRLVPTFWHRLVPPFSCFYSILLATVRTSRRSPGRPRAGTLRRRSHICSE